MQIRGYTTGEVVRLGRDIYERRIRSEVEPERDGEFVIVDVTTGHYEVDESEVVASDRALRKNPDAVLYFLRVGRHAAYRRRQVGASSDR